MAITNAADAFASYEIGVAPQQILKLAAVRAALHVALYLKQSPLPGVKES